MSGEAAGWSVRVSPLAANVHASKIFNVIPLKGDTVCGGAHF
jgi:hypothetical protein